MDSRQQFEEWFKYNYKWFIENGSPPHGLERFDENRLPGYAREIAHHDWRVWQASRESLVVEMPESQTHTGTGYIETVRHFIEKQGIRTK